MYGVVRRYADGSQLADAMTKHRQEVQDLIGGVPGFHHYSAIRSGDSVATITICADKAGTDESSRRAREWVQKNVTGAPIGTPDVTEGEVFIDFGG
jgi:hypothetical protein